LSGRLPKIQVLIFFFVIGLVYPQISFTQDYWDPFAGEADEIYILPEPKVTELQFPAENSAANDSVQADSDNMELDSGELVYSIPADSGSMEFATGDLLYSIPAAENTPETAADTLPDDFSETAASFEFPDDLSGVEEPVLPPDFETSPDDNIPPIPVDILGQGIVPEKSLSDFLIFFNPDAKDFADEIAKLYIEESSVEGVNSDAAFAQMCLETGFLHYGGLVTADMNNFCGLGAIGPGQEGETFPDARTGVRAHIQHLKAYATDEPLNNDLVDPRSIWVRSGSSPKIEGLSGTWAADRFYSDKINSILRRLYEYSFSKNYVITAIPAAQEDEQPATDEEQIIKGVEE